MSTYSALDIFILLNLKELEIFVPKKTGQIGHGSTRSLRSFAHHCRGNGLSKQQNSLVSARNSDIIDTCI